MIWPISLLEVYFHSESFLQLPSYSLIVGVNHQLVKQKICYCFSQQTNILKVCKQIICKGQILLLLTLSDQYLQLFTMKSLWEWWMLKGPSLIPQSYISWSQNVIFWFYKYFDQKSHIKILPQTLSKSRLMVVVSCTVTAPGCKHKCNSDPQKLQP